MNLKEETIEAINGRTIAFAEISDSYNSRQIFLSKKHTKEDVDYFFEQLDFEYNNGFLISGYIAFTDGTWITRSSYNGKNWWLNHTNILIQKKRYEEKKPKYNDTRCTSKT